MYFNFLFQNFFYKDSDIFFMRTHGAVAVIKIPYKKVNTDLKQFQKQAQVSKRILYSFARFISFKKSNTIIP